MCIYKSICLYIYTHLCRCIDVYIRNNYIYIYICRANSSSVKKKLVKNITSSTGIALALNTKEYVQSFMYIYICTHIYIDSSVYI